VGVEEWLEREIGMKVNVRAKIESREQKKNIMLNKSNLKKKKVRGCIQVDEDLTNKERKTKKRL
jgi:hypothetical protein